MYGLCDGCSPLVRNKITAGYLPDCSTDALSGDGAAGTDYRLHNIYATS